MEFDQNVQDDGTETISRKDSTLPSKKQSPKCDEEYPNRSKRRKSIHKRKETKVDIINKFRKEITDQWPASRQVDFAEKHVTPIIEVLLRDQEIKNMIRQTLNPDENNRSYEPKLTRAKVRQLLELRPELCQSIPVWQLKSDAVVPECLLLMQEDFPDDSSEDEEYIPNREKFTDTQSIPIEQTLPNSTGEEIDFNMSFNSIDTEHSCLQIEENISQRTRSKLPLTETTIDELTSSILPDDEFADLYERDFDFDRFNYIDFVLESTKWGDNISAEQVDGDDENDPEYRIPADADLDDAEETRRDPSTEVQPEEVIQLISDLGDLYQMRVTQPTTSTEKETDNIPIVDEHDRNDENITPNVQTSRVEPVKLHDEATNRDFPVLTYPQLCLLQQQLRQHVQLATMHFLQCYKHPTLFRHAKKMKSILTDLKFSANGNKKSTFYVSNLDGALKLVAEWEKLRADVPEPKFYLVTCRSREKKHPKFAQEMMKLVSKSCVFLYPLLLPERPFTHHSIKTIHKREMTKSEEWLLADGLYQFEDHVKRNIKLNGHRSVRREVLKLIIHYLLPGFSPVFLDQVIKRRATDSEDNSIKYYVEHKKAPPLKNFVIPLSVKPLCTQPSHLLPEVWRDYVSENFIVVTKDKR